MTAQLMRAVVFSEFGRPEVLSVIELPVPVARQGEVVVKVAATTVNPTDLLMRSGKQASLMTALTPPFIAGMEFSGHVHQVGDAPDRVKVGDAVMGIVNPRRADGGAHAEYVRVPVASVVPLSRSSPTELIEAAAVPMNGLTARMVLEALRMQRPATLLITGGAGVVAGFVIRLAKDAGLFVIADGRDADRDSLLALGCDLVVPRGQAMHEAVRAHFPHGVDGLVDTALLGDAAAALVRDGGAALSLRRSNPFTDKRLRCEYIGVLDQATNTAALEWVASKYSAGVITPRVGMRLPFAEAARAHQLLEQGGLRGRVVLTP